MSLLHRPILARTERSSQGLGRALALTATLALVTFAVLLPVMQRSDETAQGYRIRALEQQQSDLEAQIYQTQSQIAQLGALSRIDSDAKNRLGMIPVQRETVVNVSVPLPDVHTLPNAYLPPTPAAAPVQHETLWQQILHHLRIS